MSEDKLDPKRIIKSLWNNEGAKFPFNNRGEVDNGGDDGGDDGGDGGDGGGGGTATLTGDWRDNLEPSIKDHPKMAQFKTPADLAKSYVNLEQLIGKKGVPLPAKDADPMAEGGSKDWDNVFNSLGRPSDPKAYEIPKVEVPQGFPEIPEQTVDEFKSLAHKIGLLPHQVKALYAWEVQQGLSGFQQSQEAQTANLQKAETDLRSEYGKAYDSNIGAARGLLKKFGDQELLATLDKTGLGNDPNMIRFMVKVAKQFGEDGNVLVGETQAGVLTPAEAQAEIDKIMADKKGAYWNPPDDKGRKQFSDAEHKAMVAKVNGLMQMAHPGKV